MSPLLSMFYGIVVRINFERNEPHHTPHIHAYYQNDSIVVDFEGEVLSGSIPKNKLKLLLAWVEIHKEDLNANWITWNTTGEFFKIEPLK